MTSPASTYIHGSHASEQRRLTLLNELINEPALAELAVRPGERVLDVGCGLGQLTRALARAAGGPGHVVGIERDDAQLAEARRQADAAGETELVDLRSGDAAALSLADDEWGTFDVAHARFVLEHVPDPLAVVRQMVRAVRPRGRVVLADDDHEVMRYWPPAPGVARLWEAYIDSYRAIGNDPLVGRKLVSLLHQAGATPTRNVLHFFGSCAGQANFDVVIENLRDIFVGARATLLAHRLIDEPTFDAALRELDDWRRRPDAALWYSISWAHGTCPGSR